MGQAVAAFDLGKEALGHEEALLFKGGRKHHIYPQLVSPVRLAHDRQVMGWGDARRLAVCLPMRKSGSRCKRINTEARPPSATPVHPNARPPPRAAAPSPTVLECRSVSRAAGLEGSLSSRTVAR